MTARSMRIESEVSYGEEASVKLYIEGYYPISAKAGTVVQALVGLTKDPTLPLQAHEWLIPRDDVALDEAHKLRAEVIRLENVNESLRGALDSARREADGWRRMVDLLLDRIEGRRQ